MDNMCSFQSTGLDNTIGAKEFLSKLNLFSSTEVSIILKDVAELPESFFMGDRECTWSALCEYHKTKPLSMLRGVFNVMSELSHEDLYLLLGLARLLDDNTAEYNDSVTHNKILESNLLIPLAKLIKSPNFSYGLLQDAKHADDLSLLISIVDRVSSSSDAQAIYLYSKQYNLSIGEIELYLDNRHLPGFYGKDFINSKNKVAYVQSLTLKYRKEFPNITTDYLGKLPISVVSVLLFFAHNGLPIDGINVYESYFGNASFWEHTVGVTNVCLSDNDTTISADFVDNVFVMMGVLYGDFSIITGGEHVFFKLIADSAGLPVHSWRERTQPLSYQNKIFVNAGDTHYALFEGNLPFIARYLKQLLPQLVTDTFENVLADFSNHGRKNYTVYNYKYFAEYTIKEKVNNYRITPLEQILSIFSLEEFNALIRDIFALGNKTNCYDPYLLYILYKLFKEGFPIQYWYQLYWKEPSMFCACLLNIILARAAGATDYDDLLGDQLNGAAHLAKLSHTIGSAYNKASAAYLRLFIDLGLDIGALSPVLGYDVAPTIAFVGSGGTGVTVNCYDIITAEEGVLQRLKGARCNKVQCSKDLTGSIKVQLL